MSRLASRIRYYAVEAWEEFRFSPGPNLLAAAVLSASLFVAACLLLVLSNLSATLEEWGSRLRVDVFLVDGAGDEEVADLEDRLASIDGVLRVVRVDKAEALRRFRAAFRTLAPVAEELGENPLPESLEAYLEPSLASAAGSRVLETARGLPFVDQVRWDRPIMDRLDAALRFVRWGGGAIGALVFAALVLVMGGVLRLAVLARRDEIEIMRLVGAGPAMVRGPFLLAGALQGALGGGMAVVAAEVCRRAAVARAPDAGPLANALLGSSLPAATAMGIVAAGVVVGIASAWFAVGAFGRPPQPQKSNTM